MASRPCLISASRSLAARAGSEARPSGSNAPPARRMHAYFHCMRWHVHRGCKAQVCLRKVGLIPHGCLLRALHQQGRQELQQGHKHDGPGRERPLLTRVDPLLQVGAAVAVDLCPAHQQRLDPEQLAD